MRSQKRSRKALSQESAAPAAATPVAITTTKSAKQHNPQNNKKNKKQKISNNQRQKINNEKQKELRSSKHVKATNNNNNNNSNNNIAKQNASMHDFISTLVQQATAAKTVSDLPNKQERIQIRTLKKQQKQMERAAAAERKRILQKQQQQQQQQGHKTVTAVSRKQNKLLNQERIKILCNIFDSLRQTHELSSKKYYQLKQRQQQVSNNDNRNYDTKRGTSTIANISSWKETDTYIQPRPRDYGGMGLARPTLFLPFYDLSFIPRLKQEFQEHVTGFYGKQRTKAMKKQLDGNMLWRKLLQAKQNPKQQVAVPSKNITGKKLSDKTPEEKVEAMLQAGLI